MLELSLLLLLLLLSTSIAIYSLRLKVTHDVVAAVAATFCGLPRWPVSLWEARDFAGEHFNLIRNG